MGRRARYLFNETDDEYDEELRMLLAIPLNILQRRYKMLAPPQKPEMREQAQASVIGKKAHWYFDLLQIPE